MLDKDVSVVCAKTVFGDAAFSFYRVKSNLHETDGRQFHSHFYHEWHLLCQGSQIFVLPDREVAVKEGQLLIIPPAVEHLPFWSENDAQEIVFAVMLERVEGESGFYDYFHQTLFDTTYTVHTLSGEAFSDMKELHEVLLSHTLRDLCRGQSLACRIVYELFDGINGFECGKIQKNTEKQEAMLLLEALVSTPSVSLSEIAQRLNYSKRHTARLIRSMYGKTLSEYRFWLLTECAKKLLLEHPDLPMTKIAERAGFSSLSAMKRHFLQSEGMTPLAYRERNAEHE